MAGKRRGNGEGSSFQRKSDGLWQADLTLPDGKRKSVYAKTQKEVVEKKTKLLREIQQGLPMVGERETLGAYLTSWLEAAKAHLRPRSFSRYVAAIHLHIIPALGKERLSRLSAQQIEKLYAAKLAEGLAPATVVRIHAVLRKALNDALRQGRIARNVASFARAPRIERKEMAHWTPEQAATFLRAVQADELDAFYALAITTGMRRGEILALDWKHIDLDGRTLEIAYTLQDDKGGRFTFAPPKTERSRRTVPLNEIAVAALRRQKARQNQARLAVGDAWQDTRGLVFTTALGTPLRGNHILQRQFEPLCKRLGLPRVRLHDLRHTAASLYFGLGYETADISKLLGHSSTTTTNDIYIHVNPKRQQTMVAELDRLLG